MENSNIKQKVFSGLFWKFGERMGAQAVSFVVSIVLARLLMPSDYGVVAIVAAFINIADVFVTGGFSSSLIQKKDADSVDFSSVFYFSIAFSLVLYAVLFFVAPYIASAYKMPNLTLIIRVFSIRLPIAAFNSVQQAFVSRTMQFKRFFFSTIGATIGSAIVGIVMAYKGCGVWALVGQYMFNSVVASIILWFTVKWRPTLEFSFKKVQGLLSYGWKILVSSLLNTGYNELRSLVIGLKYTTNDLSFYSRGNQFPQLVVININTSISSVLFPALSQYQDDKQKVKNLTRRAIRVSSYIIWPCMFGLMMVGENFISILLGDKWLPCVPFLQIFCIIYGFWPIHTANLEAIKAIGRSDLFLIMEIIKKVIGFTALFVALQISVNAIIYGELIFTFLCCLINAFPNRKLLGYSYKEQFLDILPSIIMSAVMGALVYAVGLLSLPKIPLICLQGIVGAVFYIVVSIVLKNESFYYLISTLKDILHIKKLPLIG